MPLYVFARDLQGYGSDIVAEEDLVTLFGSCMISSMLASTFRAFGFLDLAWDADKEEYVVCGCLRATFRLQSYQALPSSPGLDRRLSELSPIIQKAPSSP
jgi:hypothetical protein